MEVLGMIDITNCNKIIAAGMRVDNGIHHPFVG